VFVGPGRVLGVVLILVVVTIGELERAVSELRFAVVVGEAWQTEGRAEGLLDRARAGGRRFCRPSPPLAVGAYNVGVSRSVAVKPAIELDVTSGQMARLMIWALSRAGNWVAERRVRGDQVAEVAVRRGRGKEGYLFSLHNQRRRLIPDMDSLLCAFVVADTEAVKVEEGLE